MSSSNLALLRGKLLRWYANNKRSLPWRRTRDPYAIWIAETMLQQTQVATVIPYYRRFLKAFPTVRALARAPRDKVLSLWSGLGYYRRGVNLHKAARQLARRHGARLPREYRALLALPGVGDYTAGAVMSIAFDEPYPALDVNARRVLGRLFALDNEKQLRAAARALLPRSRPRDFNQALMEFGATICAPRAPQCPLCPLASLCIARNASHPIPAAAKARRVMNDVAWPLAVVRRRERILLRRRRATGLLAGLWELPGGETREFQRLKVALKRALLLPNGTLGRARRIGTIRHAITNRRIRATIFLFECACAAEIRLPGPDWRWARPSALSRYPVSSMTLKAAKLLAAHDQGSR